MTDYPEPADLRIVPGSERRGRAAAEAAQQMLMAATGQTSLEDAIRVALGGGDDPPRQEA